MRMPLIIPRLPPTPPLLTLLSRHRRIPNNNRFAPPAPNNSVNRVCRPELAVDEFAHEYDDEGLMMDRPEEIARVWPEALVHGGDAPGEDVALRVVAGVRSVGDPARVAEATGRDVGGAAEVLAQAVEKLAAEVMAGAAGRTAAVVEILVTAAVGKDVEGRVVSVAARPVAAVVAVGGVFCG